MYYMVYAVFNICIFTVYNYEEYLILTHFLNSKTVLAVIPYATFLWLLHQITTNLNYLPQNRIIQ